MPGKNAPTYRMKGFSGFGNDKKTVDVPVSKNYSDTPVMKDTMTNKEKADRLNSMADKYSDNEDFRKAQTKYNQAATNDKTSGVKKLKGNQTKIDKNKDGKISKADFDIINGMPRYGNHSKGMPKTYKEAYKTRGEKYKDMGEAEYIKEAKAQNLKKYGTTKPSSDKSLSKEKKTELKTQQTTQAKKDATGVDKKRNETARVKKATVTEKKTIGPKNRVTVKAAKASKKAKIKDAKQKGYETRKDKRAAVSDARKSGRAGVKEARKNKRDLKKAEKNTRKNDKKVVKAAISDAKTAAKNDKKAPLAKYKNAAHRKAAHASMNEKKKK